MVKERIPEGGAIEDTAEWSSEKYSEFMKNKLGREYRNFVNHILKSQVLSPPRNAKCLEIGPGPGWIGIWLAEKRPDIQIVGLEPSSDMRRVAKANAESCGIHQRIEFISGVVENLESFSDGEFDFVFSNESLHHWTDPEKSFSEIKRVLKPEGKIFVKDGKRNLNLREKFVVNVLGRFMARKMWKHWRNSLNASYTRSELLGFLNAVPNHSWKVDC
jgi:ubiquinone/menaquinone biosynthesis C-methylase UbiE